MDMVTKLISIITPCYNAEKYIVQTIESVLCQTRTDWEMLVVDDCSTDGTADIVLQYAKDDPRIKYFKTVNPSGSPTLPRNIGIENATGRYIAFLDSDDVWLPTKLEEQIGSFHKNEEASIVFSYYEKMNEDGMRSDRVVKSPKSVRYADLLYGNVLGCLTGMYDTYKVGKVFMRDIGHEDYVLWLDVLRCGGLAVNTNNVQALYRVRTTSVSSNKLQAFKWQWNIYRNVEYLSIFKAIRCFVAYAFKGFLKSLK